MSDLAKVAINGVIGMVLTFWFGMNYQEAVTNQNAIHVQTLPYSEEEEPEDIISIIVHDDLRGLIDVGEAAVETWHSPGKTTITISGNG